MYVCHSTLPLNSFTLVDKNAQNCFAISLSSTFTFSDFYVPNKPYHEKGDFPEHLLGLYLDKNSNINKISYAHIDTYFEPKRVVL